MLGKTQVDAGKATALVLEFRLAKIGSHGALDPALAAQLFNPLMRDCWPPCVKLSEHLECQVLPESDLATSPGQFRETNGASQERKRETTCSGTSG